MTHYTLNSAAEDLGFSLTHPTPPTVALSHEGASTMDKSLARWQPVRASADADLLPDLPMLVSRSRDSARNNGLASGYAQTTLDNVVGTGLRLSARPDYRALGRDKAWAQEWANNTEALWRSYADSFDCDASGQLNFQGLTSQVFRAGVVNGEAISLPLWIPDGRSRWSTRFLLVESDRLCNPQNEMDSDRLRGGVEIDQYGRPLAYWLRKTHPGDWFGMFLNAGLAGDWERIPAETDWGRRRFLHVHEKERTGQTRGKPWYSPILGQFKMLDQYGKAELKSAVVSALIAAFIQTPLDSSVVAQHLGANPTSPEYQNWLSVMRQYIAPLDGGAIIPIPPGTQVQEFNPSRPATAFDSFITSMLRHIAAGLNIPYELLAKDFSKTNYSSARAALLEGWRFFKSRRQWLATYWAAPAYHLWLEESVNLGLIDAPAYYENRAAYGRCKWIGPGRGWIDPVKEAQAAGIRMDYYISTLEEECAEQGLDWEEVLEQRAVEHERMRQLGLNLAVVDKNPATNTGDEQQA